MTSAMAMMKGKMYAPSMMWLLLLSLVIGKAPFHQTTRNNNGYDVLGNLLFRFFYFYLLLHVHIYIHNLFSLFILIPSRQYVSGLAYHCSSVQMNNNSFICVCRPHQPHVVDRPLAVVLASCNLI